MKLAKQELYAFWSYDQFPYVLGGTITKIHDDSSIETKEYGPGARFSPIKIVPLKAGMIIQHDLNNRAETRRRKRDEVNTEFDTSLRNFYCFIDKSLK